MPQSRKNGKYWVDKEKFYDAIVEHRIKQALNPDVKLQLNRYIAQCIINISHGVASRYNFSNYPYRDEIILDAELTIIKYFNTFDPEVSKNPYGYFWLAAYRSGQRRVLIETEQKAIRAKSVQNMLIDTDVEGLEDFKNYMSDFIDFDVDDYNEKRYAKSKKKAQNSHYRVTTKKERDAEAKAEAKADEDIRNGNQTTVA